MPRLRLLAPLFILALACAALFAPQSASAAELAQGHPATSSGQEAASYVPGNAVDGNPATRWSSNYVDNAWWQVDLGSVQSVNEVNINWEAAYSSHYKIMVSTDGTNFTQAADVTNTGAGPHDTTFTAVDARYVRWQGVTRATQWGNSFYEFQVFGPGGGGGGGGGGGTGGPLPAGFRDLTVFSGLTEPTTVRFAPFPDNRIFVTEKSGLIKEYDNLSDPTPTIVADLRTEVHNFWDRGLLGMALHPDFPARASYDVPSAVAGPLVASSGASRASTTAGSKEARRGRLRRVMSWFPPGSRLVDAHPRRTVLVHWAHAPVQRARRRADPRRVDPAGPVPQARQPDRDRRRGQAGPGGRRGARQRRRGEATGPPARPR